MANTATATATQPLTLWYTRCPVPTGLGLAMHLDVLEKTFSPQENFRLALLQSASDPAILQAHFTHSLDNAFRFGGNIPAIYARASGADTRVIGLAFVQGPQTVLSRHDSNIRTPADLKGKRLLLQRRPHESIDFVYATALRTYEVALKQAGLTLDDVELVEQIIERKFIDDKRSSLHGNRQTQGAAAPGRYTDLVSPLIRGEVDAIASGTIGSPTPQMEFFFGFQRVFDLASLPFSERANNSTPLTLTVSQALLAQHPDAVERFLLSILRANEFARKNPAQTQQFIAREQTTSEDIVQQAFGDTLADSLQLDFEPYKIAALAAQKNYLLQLGLIPQDFDLTTWLAPEPLARAQVRLAQHN